MERRPGRPPAAPARIQLLVKATLERLLPTIVTKLEGDEGLERRDVLTGNQSQHVAHRMWI